MYLPEDLVKLILLKLPSTKSAVRLSHVCKSWHDLVLKDADFRNKFKFKNDDPTLVFQRHEPPSKNRILSEDGYQIRTSKSRTTRRFPYDIRKLKEIGSCNGILCFQEIIPNLSLLQVHLYNPITREHRKIDNPSPGVVAFGFGYDRSSEDYKVVRFKIKKSENIRYNYAYYFQNHNRDDVKNTFSAEIYRFSTRCWSKLEDVEFQITCNRLESPLSSKFVYAKNGCCYWESATTEIISFNFRTEKINLVDLRQTDVPKSPYDLGLLDESLAVCISRPSGKSVETETWVREKVGSKVSWISCYRIAEVELIRSKDRLGGEDEEGNGACWYEDGGLYQLKPNGKVATLQKRVRKEAKTKLFRFDCPLYSMTFKPSLVSLGSS